MGHNSFKSIALLSVAIFLSTGFLPALPVQAQFRTTYTTPSGTTHNTGHQGAPLKYGSGFVYPQYKSSYGTIHWLKEQMPLRVYIAHGQAVDQIIDPTLGAPIANVSNLNQWPDLVAHILQAGQLESLPQAQGYTDSQYQAATDGILSWKPFEHEGLFSYVLTTDPAEADIYVFWVNHFVDKTGMALFANDIKGYTAKRSFPTSAVLSGTHIDFKPVVIMLRTTESNGTTMAYPKMRAAAAHEFGHALGIEGHSTYASDLMSIYYGNGTISPNDAATIRYLYHQAPDLVP